MVMYIYIAYFNISSSGISCKSQSEWDEIINRKSNKASQITHRVIVKAIDECNNQIPIIIINAPK